MYNNKIRYNKDKNNNNGIDDSKISWFLAIYWKTKQNDNSNNKTITVTTKQNKKQT
jgi:hypothetical protein